MLQSCPSFALLPHRRSRDDGVMRSRSASSRWEEAAPHLAEEGSRADSKGDVACARRALMQSWGGSIEQRTIVRHECASHAAVAAVTYPSA